MPAVSPKRNAESDEVRFGLQAPFSRFAVRFRGRTRRRIHAGAGKNGFSAVAIAVPRRDGPYQNGFVTRVQGIASRPVPPQLAGRDIGGPGNFQ